MEILSAGEKIKRRRIYKGLTLKDICGDKISVSKMSCIENNKIEAEDWILEVIADKLELDIDYLKYGVREQIEANIDKFNAMKRINYLEDVLHNIEYAEKYHYYDLSCKLFQILFEYYLQHGMSTELSTTIPRYYNSCQKSKDELLHINYYMYIAKYLYQNEEYAQAGSYLATVRKKLLSLNKQESIEYIKATYNKCVIHIACNNFEKAKEIAMELEKILTFNKSEYINAEIYKILAIVEIALGGSKTKYYESEALNRYGDMLDKKALAYYDLSIARFDKGLKEEGLEYIKLALNEFPKENSEEVCEFLINVSKTLVEQEYFELALECIEEVLNLSIEVDLIPVMEKAYYYKALVYEKQKNYIMAETYMILSLDTLLKYGSKSDICKRYMKVGKMYHEMGSIRDSLRYFDLAFKECSV